MHLFVIVRVSILKTLEVLMMMKMNTTHHKNQNLIFMILISDLTSSRERRTKFPSLIFTTKIIWKISLILISAPPFRITRYYLLSRELKAGMIGKTQVFLLGLKRD